ncbi:hypothetical protein ACW14Y_40800 [Kitasatospora sp. cg17-2]
MTTIPPDEWAVKTLAVALTHDGIAAEDRYTEADGHHVSVPLTRDSRYAVLELHCLRGFGTVEWFMLDGRDKPIGWGEWRLVASDDPAPVVALVRSLLARLRATPGPPALPSVRDLVHVESESWNTPEVVCFRTLVGALVSGRATPVSTDQDLVDLYPDLDCYWREARDAIEAIAHGWVSAEDSNCRFPEGQVQISLGPELMLTYGPAALAALRVGTDGDLVKAARLLHSEQ